MFGTKKLTSEKAMELYNTLMDYDMSDFPRKVLETNPKHFEYITDLSGILSRGLDLIYKTLAVKDWIELIEKRLIDKCPDQLSIINEFISSLSLDPDYDEYYDYIRINYEFKLAGKRHYVRNQRSLETSEIYENGIYKLFHDSLKNTDINFNLLREIESILQLIFFVFEEKYLTLLVDCEVECMLRSYGLVDKAGYHIPFSKKYPPSPIDVSDDDC